MTSKEDAHVLNHSLTLRAIIGEARYHNGVFCYFVDFQKAFESLLREALFQ